MNDAIRERRMERADGTDRRNQPTGTERPSLPEASCPVIQVREGMRRLVVGKGRNCCAEPVALKSWLPSTGRPAWRVLLP